MFAMAWAWVLKNVLGNVRVMLALGAIALALGLWSAYDGLSKANAELRTQVGRLEGDLATQRKTANAAISRVDDFVAAQEDFQRRLDALSQTAAAAREEARRIREEFAALDLEEARRDPDGAADAVSRQHNDVLDRLRNATRTDGSGRPTEP